MEVDSIMKVVLSNIVLVIIHQTEQVTQSKSITKAKIISDSAPQVNNPNFIVSNIFNF